MNHKLGLAVASFLSVFALANASFCGPDRQGKKLDMPAPPKASDVALIADWLRGKDPNKAFNKPFGDGKMVADGKDSLLYTDIPDAKIPGNLRLVTYEFIHARMRRIKSGHADSPAVLIVRSSRDEPAEDVVRDVTKNTGGRYYYVEVGIGNLAWHWMKIVIGEQDGKNQAQVLWRRVS
jgi:hypothetical protein